MRIFATFFLLMKGGEHMCCGTTHHHGYQRWNHPSVCACGCLGVDNPRPRFVSKKQQIANLEKHLEDLQEEVRAVKEAIAGIKKEK